MRPVLIVEDDASLRQVLRWALEDEGLAVDTVADGHQALAWLAQHKPALLLLDWGLPGLSGEQVAAGLRATHGLGVPIVLVTADGRAAAKAEHVGALSYVRKPFDLDELIGAVHRGLQRS